MFVMTKMILVAAPASDIFLLTADRTSRVKRFIPAHC